MTDNKLFALTVIGINVDKLLTGLDYDEAEMILLTSLTKYCKQDKVKVQQMLQEMLRLISEAIKEDHKNGKSANKVLQQ